MNLTKEEIDAVPSPLRRARLRRGLSQYALAVAAGLSPPTIAAAEKYGVASARTAERVAKALGCEPEDLFLPPRSAP